MKELPGFPIVLQFQFYKVRLEHNSILFLCVLKYKFQFYKVRLEPPCPKAAAIVSFVSTTYNIPISLNVDN